MNPVIKLSAPARKEFWEIEVLYEDEHLLAINKPSRLLSSPDRYDPDRPNLMKLLHSGIASGASWARARGITYLANAHRLDFETSGAFLLTKNKEALVALADQFGSEKPTKNYVALVHGTVDQNEFEVDLKLAPHPVKIGMIRPDLKRGKKSRTLFRVMERYRRYTLIHAQPLTGRTHQIRVHLQARGYAVVGDSLYGGHPLLLSSLKSAYRLKPGQVEKPLIERVALHAESITVAHPAGGDAVTISAPWPKDFQVAVKYLRRYAAATPL